MSPTAATCAEASCKHPCLCNASVLHTARRALLLLALDPAFVLPAELDHEIRGIRIRAEGVEGADLLADSQQHLQSFELLAQPEQKRELLHPGIGRNITPTISRLFAL